MPAPEAVRQYRLSYLWYLPPHLPQSQPVSMQIPFPVLPARLVCCGLPASVWKNQMLKQFSGLSQPVFLHGRQPFQPQEPPQNVLTYAVNGAYGRA